MHHAERRVIAGPAYVDFSLDSPDRALTWSEFDHAAANLAHRLLALGVGPGDGVAVWHKEHIGNSRSAGRDRTLRCGNCRARSASGRA